MDSIRAGTIMRERAMAMGALAISPNTEVIGIDVAGGRQPISENLSPLGPKNHSMCVAEVSRPRTEMTRRPISRTSSYSASITRLVAMICGEIQRVRIASSTPGK